MTIPAPIQVMTAESGHARSQPSTPPALASCTIPSDGIGCELKTWHSPETETSRIPRPMPMRVLSWTELGWRNSQAANSTMITGRAYATRPKRPPNVQTSSVWATVLSIRNHSTTAPAMASRKRKKGTPSRRSSLANFSGPSARNAPPTMCASAIQMRTSRPGFGSAAGYFTVFWAAVFAAGLRAVEPPRAGVFRAREVDLVLVAMPTRYFAPPSLPGKGAGVSPQSPVWQVCQVSGWSRPSCQRPRATRWSRSPRSHRAAGRN